MPVNIVDESYNGQESLIANANDWVDGQIDFSVRFAVVSSTQNLIAWNVQGSNFWFQLQQGDFGELGFLAGDTITASYKFIAAPVPLQNQSFTFTVDSVQGNKLYVTAAFGLNPSLGNPFVHINGRKFPTDGYVKELTLLANRAPASVEFEFNLAPNGSTLLNSMIDSELNRFELPVVTGIPTGVPQLMTQFVNKSGGLFKDVDITLTNTPGGGWRDYRIRYKFMQWGIIQDGFTEPNYYDLADCLAPINQIKCFAEYGNPNGILTDLSENVEANTGGYDENYNGGVSAYSSISTSWVDFLGDTIDRLDFSNTSTFTAIVDAPNQSNPNSTYRMSLEWRPINGLFYLNKPTNLGENLLVIAPEVDFMADGVADPTIYQGYTDPSGARWDFQNLKFELTGVDELTITGDIIPNAAATLLFEGVPDGGRRSTLAVSIGDYTSDGTVYSDRVRLKLFDEDNYDAPTKGVQIPNVIDESLLDHDGNEIITPAPQTTTEDDVLYISNFNLLDNINYEGVRARIYAYNTSTEESFTLEDIFFNFANVPVIAGQFQPNFINGRGFNLPPTTDRNHISLVRNPANDVPGQYGLTLEYGYLSRWEYWLSQPNVDNDFFDITQPFDGKNKNWQRFSNSGDWVVRLSYYTRLDGVDDFNDLEIGIRPYEDDPDITTTSTIFVPALNISPSNLVGDQINEVTVLKTWSTGIYTNAWSEVTIEDFESGNRWVLSSVLDQGNVSANPLKPMAGQTGLQLDFPAVNVARMRFIVDTNIVSANKVSLSRRIYSEDNPLNDFLITVSKDAECAYSLRKLSTNAVYPHTDPCITVRRSSDNVEFDIGFTGSPLALNVGTPTTVGSLLWAVTNNGTEASNDGFVAKWFDQGGNNNHAIQTTLLNQPKIVSAGVVEVDINGLPTLEWDGANDYFDLTAGINTSQIFYQSFVFERATGGINSISLGNVSSTPSTTWWINTNSLLSSMPSNVVHDFSVDSGQFLITTLRDSSNDIKMWRDGVSLTTATVVDGGTVLTRLGSRTVTRHMGQMSECIYFAKDKESDRVSIESNTNNYYS